MFACAVLRVVLDCWQRHLGHNRIDISSIFVCVFKKLLAAINMAPKPGSPVKQEESEEDSIDQVHHCHLRLRGRFTQPTSTALAHNTRNSKSRPGAKKTLH